MVSQIIILFIAGTAFVGCVHSHPNLNTPHTPHSAKAALQRAHGANEVLLIHYPSPGFIAGGEDTRSWMAGAGAIFGAAGAAVGAIGDLAVAHYKASADADAKSVLTQQPIRNPALQIKEKFLVNPKMRAQLPHMRSLSEPQEPFSDEELVQMREAMGNGLTLDFDTIRWGFRSSDSGHQLQYKLRTRLVDLGKTQILWEGSCHLYGRSIRSLVEWSANNGAALKAGIDEITDLCVEEIIGQLLTTSTSVGTP